MTEAPVKGAPVAVPALHHPPAGLPRAPEPRRSAALVPWRRYAARLSNEWLPHALWSVSRTGRPGLAGLALVGASAVFLVSTHVRVVDEVASLRSELTTARARAVAAPRAAANEPLSIVRRLPQRAEMPALLGVLLDQASAAHLSIDTGKYEMSSTKTGDVVRYQVSFPVTGPYPQVREFIDATLAAMPAVAISDLSLERKTIGDPVVEAQIRMTVFVRSTP